MISFVKSLYLTHPRIVAYMLQSTEYQVWPYLKWYWRTQNFATVMRRRSLDRTRRAKLVWLALLAGMALQALAGLLLIAFGLQSDRSEFVLFGLALLLAYPVFWAHLIVLPLLAAKYFYTIPRQNRVVAASAELFKQHPAAKVAIVGSYGKTTMKELLLTVLGAGIKVAATPANRNVASSHATFVAGLDGDEEVLLIEYGEGAPGDVGRFAQTTHPDHAVITGVAPAHLDQYKTLEAAAEDIFSVTDFVSPQKTYVNADSAAARPYIRDTFQQYDQSGIGAWKVSKVAVSLDGTSFTLTRGKQKLDVVSKLLGRHQIGPLCAAIALGMELGISDKDLLAGIANTEPYEHRMRTYRLGGAVIIDDTYNGNLEGVRAGTALLAELESSRKWYVTPGLVDQGALTGEVHEEMGQLIAAAKPNVVVLMQNSVTEHIRKGLDAAGYKGDIRIQTDPLAFYTHLEHFVSAGDLVLMQNDWTDNYA
jgi:UDP-N-acetylmuramoyl-tripeptide--D-alanyl-D-alanine ligase